MVRSAPASFAADMSPPPRTLEVPIVAQDPTVRDLRSEDPERMILRAKVKVPADRIEPGPRGPRFQVVDYDATTGRYRKPAGAAVLDRVDAMTDRQLLASPSFRAWNMYAIAARTLAAFEFALGRPVPWGFGSHQLFLVPSAFVEANAYYTDADRALLFGYFPRDGGTGYSCLSHDIVAHETAHAIIDGLRRRFDLPGLPDQAAFHEGFSDVVALLLVFSVPEVVQTLIGDPRRSRLTEDEVSTEELGHTALLKLGEQLGDAVHENHGNGLRRSVGLPPTTAWKDLSNPDWVTPHERGEILVAAIMHTLVLMWRERLVALTHHGTLNRVRAAEEGASAARHLLEMCIRAMDYCPPVDFEFADFLTAVLVSDADMAPDDEQNYRGALTDAFARFGIEPVNTLDRIPGGLSLRDFNFQALKADRDEVFRFIWDNAAGLGIDTQYYLKVEDVIPSTRIGPNGFVVSETVVNYVQQISGTAAELSAAFPQLRVPKALDPESMVTMFGGGTMIFDQFGLVKHHLAKHLGEWDRQSRRLAFLVDQALKNPSGAYGSSIGLAAGQRFAAYHRPAGHRGEEW